MKLQRICKTCRTPFIAIKTTQSFCHRRCFKKDYYVRTKERFKDYIKYPKFPKKTCIFCNQISMLPFDPIRSPKKFDTWNCPYCGVTNEIIWLHQDNPRSFSIIANIISSFHSQGTVIHVEEHALTVVFSGTH